MSEGARSWQVMGDDESQIAKAKNLAARVLKLRSCNVRWNTKYVTFRCDSKKIINQFASPENSVITFVNAFVWIFHSFHE